MNDKKTRKSHNDTAISVRLPKTILAQLQQLSDMQYKSTSNVIRDLIIVHIQNHQNFLIAKGATPSPATKPIPKGFDSLEEYEEFQKVWS